MTLRKASDGHLVKIDDVDLAKDYRRPRFDPRIYLELDVKP
jgi:hypothetical protein